MPSRFCLVASATYSYWQQHCQRGFNNSTLSLTNNIVMRNLAMRCIGYAICNQLEGKAYCSHGRLTAPFGRHVKLLVYTSSSHLSKRHRTTQYTQRRACSLEQARPVLSTFNYRHFASKLRVIHIRIRTIQR